MTPNSETAGYLRQSLLLYLHACALLHTLIDSAFGHIFLHINVKFAIIRLDSHGFRAILDDFALFVRTDCERSQSEVMRWRC